ncbi:MAG: (2Fe-2S)-binding protein [Phycisphaerae bacterium]
MGTERVEFTFNGRRMTAVRGSTVAGALLSNGMMGFRQSVSGEERGPVCGMGTCYECRVTIDGVAHRKGCQVEVVEGMRVVSDA